MARWSRRAALTLAVALAGGAQACELACQKLVSPVQVDSLGHPRVVDGFPALTWPNAAGMVPIDRYPAVIGYRITVENVADEPSAIDEIQDSLARIPARQIVGTFGQELTPGLTLDVGASAQRTVLVRLDSYEDCLALGAVDADASVCGEEHESRTTLLHAAGFAECRARISCAPEPGRWEGLKQLGTSTSDEAAVGIAILPSGRLYVAGWTNGTLESAPAGDFDGFLAAIDRDGDLLRLRQYPSFDSIWRLRASPTCVSSGLAAVEVAGGTDLQAVKLGLHGDVIWATGLPGELSDAHDLAVDPDGAVYVTGSTALDDSTVGFIVRIDSAGRVDWVRQLDRSDAAAIAAFDGFVYVLGATADGDAFVQRWTRDGVREWETTFGTPGADDPVAIAVGPDGDAYAVGSAPGTTAASQVWVARLCQEGGLAWLSLEEVENPLFAKDVAVDARGRLWLAAVQQQPLTLLDEIVVLGFSDDGAVRWTTDVPLPEGDVRGIAVDAAGNGYVAGASRGDPSLSADVLIAKLSPEGVLQ